jgi:ABC-2 type transport system ATP-binding protein
MMQEVNLSPVMQPREMVAQVASYYPTPYAAAEVINACRSKYRQSTLRQALRRPERQVQFGMAIAGRPELLFLDEPSVGLDVHAREACGGYARPGPRRLLRSC